VKEAILLLAHSVLPPRFDSPPTVCQNVSKVSAFSSSCRLGLKRDDTRQKPDFVFRRNGRVHLNRRGRQFSRLLAAEVCTSAVVMLDTSCSEVAWRVLVTHSIHQFPLHFHSHASPCAITFQLDSRIRQRFTPTYGSRPSLHYVRARISHLSTITTETYQRERSLKIKRTNKWSEFSWIEILLKVDVLRII
jgi:hypothetical protein